MNDLDMPWLLVFDATGLAITLAAFRHREDAELIAVLLNMRALTDQYSVQARAS